MNKLILFIMACLIPICGMAESPGLTPELTKKFQSLPSDQKGQLSKKYNDSEIFKKLGFQDGKDAFTYCGAVENYKLAKYSKESPPDMNGNGMQREMALTKMKRDNCQARVSELVQQGYWNYEAFGALNKKYLVEISSAAENVQADGGQKLGQMVALADTRAP